MKACSVVDAFQAFSGDSENTTLCSVAAYCRLVKYTKVQLKTAAVIGLHHIMQRAWSKLVQVGGVIFNHRRIILIHCN